MTTKAIARVAGIGYLFIFFSGFFSNFYVLEGLTSAESSLETASNIFSNIDLYTWGLVGFVLMIVVDILMAGPLYALLKSTNKELALFSSALRMVNGTIFAVALYSLFEVAALYKVSAGDAAAVHQQVDFALQLFQSMWSLALLIFGLHLAVLGFLMVRSQAFPSAIGALLLVAGIAYLIDCTAQIGYSNYADYKEIFQNIVVMPAVIGEFSFTLFLLIKGVRAPKPIEA